jgi:RNA polymerase sigma-70 factor (ECF subfamily)
MSKRPKRRRKGKRAPPQVVAKINQVLIDSSYRTTTVKWLCNRTGSLADAEDIYQEACKRAIAGAHTFKGLSSCKTWIGSILGNALIAVLKGRSKYRHLIETIRKDRPPNEKGPLDALILKEIEEQVRGTLNNMREDLSGVFILRQEGFSRKEIAKELGLPIHTIKGKIECARKEFRDKFPEDK